MPPVSQGSRAGLITAVVIFVILFVTATIFAIYYGVELTRTKNELETFKKRTIPEIVTENALVGPEVQELRDARDEPKNNFKGMTLLNVALEQRNRLAKVIGAKPGEARAAAANALSGAANKIKPAGVSLPAPTENLVGAVTTLSDAVAAQYGQLQDKDKQLAAAKAETQQKITEHTAALQAKDKQIADIRAEADAAIANATTDLGNNKQVLEEIQKARDEAQAAAQEAQQKMQVDMATMQRDNENLKKQLDAVRQRLGGLRTNVSEPLVRQPDGQIVRVAGGNIVYIDLGAGDQITPGLTFEVYDKAEGIPKLQGAEDEELPAGKASIEVIRVGSTSSEARVVKTQPGQTISQGDPIVNLIYDPNVKFNFMVFGNFDMDQNGQATPGDAEIIKRLITQWGGSLIDKVNVDTDFLVLGKEPEIPQFTEEELTDPFNAKKLADAEAERTAYLDVAKTAQDLHIPIMNQNRFLYFIGYFDQAKR